MDFDQDGNGVLTETELKRALSTYDQNDNGVLETDELVGKLKEAGLKDEDLVDLIMYLDNISSGGMGGDDDEGGGILFEDFINGIFSMYNPCTRKDALEILAAVKTLQGCIGGGGAMSELVNRLNNADQQISKTSNEVIELRGHLKTVQEDFEEKTSLIIKKLDQIQRKLYE